MFTANPTWSRLVQPADDVITWLRGFVVQHRHGFKPGTADLPGLRVGGDRHPDVPGELQSLSQQRPLRPGEGVEVTGEGEDLTRGRHLRHHLQVGHGQHLSVGLRGLLQLESLAQGRQVYIDVARVL